METPLLGLRRREDKATKLHHTLQIDIYQEDCKIFDLLLISYCLTSITYKSFYYFENFELLKESTSGYYTSIALDLIGLVYWAYGIYLSYEGLSAYSYMRSKDIHSSAEKLKFLAFIQTLYFVLNSVILIFENINTKMTTNELLLVISVLTLLILSSIFVTLYFHSQKLGLAQEIQRFDSSNRENPAYHKTQRTLDI